MILLCDTIRYRLDFRKDSFKMKCTNVFAFTYLYYFYFMNKVRAICDARN